MNADDIDVDGDGEADDVDTDAEIEQMQRWSLRHDIHSVAANNLRDLPILEAYVEWTYPYDSFEGHVNYLLERPHLCRSVIENSLLSDAHKWDLLVSCLALPKPRIRTIYVLGEPGSGKSTFAYDLAKSIQDMRYRPVVEVGDSADTPPFVERQLSRVDDAPPHAIVVDNEAALNNASKNAQTKEGKAVGPAAATIRHNDWIWIIVSQNSRLANSIFYSMASMIVFKPLGLTQAQSERPAVRRTIRYWNELIPRDHGRTFVLSKHIQPLSFWRPAPDWYSDALSTAYSRITDHAEAMRIATAHRKRNMSWQVLATRMAARYQPWHHDVYRKSVLAWNGGKDPATGERPRKRRQPTRRKRAA